MDNALMIWSRGRIWGSSGKVLLEKYEEMENLNDDLG